MPAAQDDSCAHDALCIMSCCQKDIWLMRSVSVHLGRTCLEGHTQCAECVKQAAVAIGGLYATVKRCQVIYDVKLVVWCEVRHPGGCPKGK